MTATKLSEMRFVVRFLLAFFLMELTLGTYFGLTAKDEVALLASGESVETLHKQDKFYSETCLYGAEFVQGTTPAKLEAQDTYAKWYTPVIAAIRASGISLLPYDTIRFIATQ